MLEARDSACSDHEMEPPPTLEEQIATIDANISSLRSAFTHGSGDHKGQIVEPDVLREIQCLEATRRILVWATFHPAAASIGIGLTPAQRNELKGLEAACLETPTPTSAALWALTQREKELGVYDDLAFSPRWQD